MIQEKDFLYRVPVKTAPITTPGGQIRNPEILVDVEGGEFMHGNILDANSTNKLINQSVKDAVDNKLIESGYVTKDLLEAETTRATEQENSLKTLIGAETSARTKGDEDLSSKIKAEQTRAEGKEKEISDKLAIVNGDSNTEGSFRKAIADVVAAAPEDLDTLKEIADKLAGNDDLHTALNQAITEKADATALSNYVLTTALNQQVDTLNTAISAKQDAGNYIPYNAGVEGSYQIDKALNILTDNGTAKFDPQMYIAMQSNDGKMLLVQPTSLYGKSGGSAININASGISLIDDDNVIQLSSNGVTLPYGDHNYVLTSNGSTINMGNYATQSDLSSQLSSKANRSDLAELEQKVTANTTAIEGKQDAGHYVTYIRNDGSKYTLQKGFEFSNGTDKVAIDESGVDLNISGNSIIIDDSGIMANDGGNNYYSIDYNGINLSSMHDEIRISPIGISSADDEDTNLFNIDSTAIILGPTNNPNVKISEEGIKFKGRAANDIPTAGGEFVKMSSFVLTQEYNSKIKSLEARIAALEAKLS